MVGNFKCANDVRHRIGIFAVDEMHATLIADLCGDEVGERVHVLLYSFFACVHRLDFGDNEVPSHIPRNMEHEIRNTGTDERMAALINFTTKDVVPEVTLDQEQPQLMVKLVAVDSFAVYGVSLAGYGQSEVRRRNVRRRGHQEF